MRIFIQVDPRILHLPPSRMSGADPIKLTRQLSKHGIGSIGMPPILIHRDKLGRLKIVDGVTRATRMAKWVPGVWIEAEVTYEDPQDDFSKLPTVGDRLP